MSRGGQDAVRRRGGPRLDPEIRSATSPALRPPGAADACARELDPPTGAPRSGCDETSTVSLMTAATDSMLVVTRVQTELVKEMTSEQISRAASAVRNLEGDESQRK